MPAIHETRLPVPCSRLRGQRILISQSGARFRDIAVDPLAHCMLLSIEEEGAAYGAASRGNIASGSRHPTSELPTHLLVHDLLAAERPGYTALLHAHVNELIAMSMHPGLRTKDAFASALMSVHPEMPVYFPGGIGFVPYIDAGTSAIGEATTAEFRTVDIVVWQRHGVLAVGRDIDEAFDRIAIAAKAASLWLLCRQNGFDPCVPSA